MVNEDSTFLSKNCIHLIPSVQEGMRHSQHSRVCIYLRLTLLAALFPIGTRLAFFVWARDITIKILDMRKKRHKIVFHDPLESMLVFWADAKRRQRGLFICRIALDWYPRCGHYWTTPGASVLQKKYTKIIN